LKLSFTVFISFIRYVYGWVSMDYWRMSLVKRDLEEPSKDRVWARRSHYPGELTFIPNPGRKFKDFFN
jgi:hypothetical protein